MVEYISNILKFNANLDKGTPECYGFKDGDESWEVLNNTSNNVIMKTADFTTWTVDKDGNPILQWQLDFESRYPEDYTDTAQLQEWLEWLVSTDRTAATNEELAAPVTYDGVEYTTDSADYRLAKFKAEAPNYMEMQSALFYYLFTEVFLMVDSRAKNMFPSFIGSAVN